MAFPRNRKSSLPPSASTSSTPRRQAVLDIRVAAAKLRVLIHNILDVGLTVAIEDLRTEASSVPSHTLSLQRLDRMAQLTYLRRSQKTTARTSYTLRSCPPLTAQTYITHTLSLTSFLFLIPYRDVLAAVSSCSYTPESESAHASSIHPSKGGARHFRQRHHSIRRQGE